MAQSQGEHEDSRLQSLLEVRGQHTEEDRREHNTRSYLFFPSRQSLICKQSGPRGRRIKYKYKITLKNKAEE